jgi:hypothetical protein
MTMSGQLHYPAALTPVQNPESVEQDARWAPGPDWTGAENLAPTGIRFPDRPARSQSLMGPIGSVELRRRLIKRILKK